MELDGKVAVVTGSTKGIGRAVAEAMTNAGASVVVSSRTATDVERLTAELEGRGRGRAIGIPCDVSDPEACAALVEDTVARLGRLDILVNNAGLGRFAPVDELSIEDWQAQIGTNLSGVFHCSRVAIPHLEAAGGWIVNIGSLAGKNAFAGGSAYNASKFGLIGLTDAMMLDLRHRGIRVSVIMPGTVHTRFFDSPEAGEARPAEGWELLPEDCARAVVDLLAYPGRALPSRIELRPSRPPRK